jgi:hypothetical protein
LDRAAAMTEAAGSWLVVDNTYEHFTYDGAEHACVEGRNVINIFSFSKAYGMMGWRVGYICYPRSSVHATLGSQMLKVQVRLYHSFGLKNGMRSAFKCMHTCGATTCVAVHTFDTEYLYCIIRLSLSTAATASSRGGDTIG